MRLADALVDQGCYQEAVGVLEAVQESFPRNAELSAKLRDVRSLVTEQTYIEGLTQAAESAKLARNQLRCTRLADITACEDALRSKPDDPQLLVAKGDALIQANRPAEALTAYQHAAALKPGDEAIKTKLTAAETLQASISPAPGKEPPAVTSNATPLAAAPVKTPKRSSAVNATVVAAADKRTAPKVAVAPADSIAALTTAEIKTYSNDAPPGQTN
jgi:tetratricopeptide (TPR) repeat protein